MKNTPLQAIPMTHFLFPSNDMVETPVSALPFRSGKDVVINAIKRRPLVEVTFYRLQKLHSAVYIGASLLISTVRKTLRAD
jgi:hypothetical protein